MTANWRRRVRLAVLLLLGVFPGFAKKPLYRLLFGYRFGPRVRIGLALLDAGTLEFAEGTQIGHFNVITRVGRFETGRHARIGTLNVIRGGERVSLGDYAEVMRLNVLNAIPDHDCTTEPESVLEVATKAVITSGHRIDFTDRVRLGKNVIVGGRNSSLWTHNRQGDSSDRDRGLLLPGQRGAAGAGGEAAGRVSPRDRLGSGRGDQGAAVAGGWCACEGSPAAH
jgi:hypothetical protein